MVNANLQEQGFPLSMMSAESGLSDFNSRWFSDIGVTLTGAMLFNVYWPIVEFFIWAFVRQAKRFIDRGFSFQEYHEGDETMPRTSKKSLQTYVEVYSGPVFFIHYKYSAILNIAFVTMMYGMGLPILFPIAAFSFLTLYCMEKLLLHYVYREPPMYDEKLNKNALAILTYAPILFLAFGYWMLSSKQLLGNDLPHTWKYLNDVDIESGHHWTEVFTNAAYQSSMPSMPLLVTFWVLLILVLFRNTLLKLWNKITYLSVANFDIDEGLPNYFESLDENDLKWSVFEERYSREIMNLTVLDDETLKNLEHVRDTKLNATEKEKAEYREIKGTHCYDILANEQYKAAFQYYSPQLDDERNDYIKDDDDDEGNDAVQSDFVKMMLNLAFFTEKDLLDLDKKGTCFYKDKKPDDFSLFEKNAAARELNKRIN